MLGVILAAKQVDQGGGNLNLVLGVSLSVLMSAQFLANLYHGIICGPVVKSHCFGFENSKGFLLAYTFGSLVDGKYK